jgi:sulfur-oxidizing protein SoxY
MARMEIGRRRVLAGAAAIAVGGTVGGIAGRAAAAPATLREAIDAILDGRSGEPGGIDLDLPRVAEDGSSVPVTVTVDSPMTEDDHVRAIHLLAEGNPLPGVATFHMGPANGEAVVSTRIRLAESQRVYAFAELADGRVLQTRQEITVTIGGCG